MTTRNARHFAKEICHVLFNHTEREGNDWRNKQWRLVDRKIKDVVQHSGVKTWNTASVTERTTLLMATELINIGERIIGQSASVVRSIPEVVLSHCKILKGYRGSSSSWDKSNEHWIMTKRSEREWEIGTVMNPGAQRSTLMRCSIHPDMRPRVSTWVKYVVSQLHTGWTKHSSFWSRLS